MTERRTATSVRLSKPVKEKAKREAKARGLSLNQLVAQALRKYMAENPL